jgi:LAS superfamily LD-carboxypeptidase LdcB
MQHCGTSQYAIYQMPAEQCSPPTARPGASKHEQGLAIDFTWNGSTIQSRGSAAFQWLAAHAGGFGFVNLPSEPWHWSMGGG